MRRTRAMTLTEVLVALFIFIGFAGGVYYLIKEVNVKRAIGMARSMATNEAGKVLSVMQQDFAAAKLGSFKNLDEIKPSFKVGVGKVGQEMTVTYEYKKPTLTRTIGPWQWTIAKNLDEFKVSKQLATGQVLIEVKSKVAIDGLAENRAQIHEQNQMVIMRADNSAMNDPHWRDVGDATGLVSMKGDLIAGIETDMEDFVGNAIDELGELGGTVNVGALAGASTAELAQKLSSQWQQILGQLDSIDQRIQNTAPEGILKFPEDVWEKIYYNEDNMKSCANAMKTCLVNQKTLSSMSMDPIRNIASGYGYNNRVRETVQGLFDAKKSVFQAGQ
ncbi:MAG TPA: hypothetical protein PKO06_22795, partial [Candidatus Ozemobacteraceae bacterium]|nr:hypothetical protein [Candidatus Ozemobacteraceae bacterium]